MKRRDFIALCGAFSIGPTPAPAQLSGTRVIGMLGPVPFENYQDRVGAFREGLKQSGFPDPQAIPIEYLWPGPGNIPWSQLVTELIRRRVSIIATAGDAAPHAAKAATTSVPVVFVMGGDPVEQGLVASLSRPGGNLTGASTLNVEIHTKRIEILRELLPKARQLFLLVNPSSKSTTELLRRETELAGAPRGFVITVVGASSISEIDSAFEKMAESRPDALLIGANVLFNVRSQQLGTLVARYGIPAVYQTSEFARAGGLVSYGSSLKELFQMQGNYVGRILSGQKPADLPIQQASRIEMSLNLKSAKALGIEVPTALLVRADEVIE